MQGAEPLFLPDLVFDQFVSHQMKMKMKWKSILVTRQTLISVKGKENGSWYTLHRDECESVKHMKQGSSASGKTLKHLTLTHTHYTHTTTIYHLCLKSWLFRFIMGFMYLIASVVLRPYKRLNTLGVMYKSSMERSLSFWDFGFKF